MNENKRFVPVRGIEEKIAANVMGFHDGYLYFATDTGHIYLDYIDNDGNEIARAPIGGITGGAGNSGIYYANRILTGDEKLETDIVFPIDQIEGGQYPIKDDIIVNIPEGSLYRVIMPSPLTSSVTAKRLTIAGGGGGTSTLAEDIDLIVEPLETINLINGQSALIYFTPFSAKNAKGNPIDNQITITYTLSYTEDGTNYTTYKTGIDQYDNGVRAYLDFGKIARPSSSSRLILKATQQSVENASVIRTRTFKTSKLELTPDSTFSNIGIKELEAATLKCNAIGNMDKIIEYYFDNPDEPIYTKELTEEDSENQTLNLNTLENINLTHGSHEVWIRLYQSINGNKGIEVEPLHFEIAIKESQNEKAIIWLGEYKNTYYSYDVIQIPFRVFNPLSPQSTEVHFYKNNRELENSPVTISDNTKFSYFEIADAELNVLNRYSISCGIGTNEVSRNIEFTVVQDPNRRDFGIQKKDDLVYMLDTIGSGRSNNESYTKRQTLIYKKSTNNPIQAQLTNFNWYNNGWIRGNDNKTCLRISNGAQLSIPIGPLYFATENGTDNEITHTIELQFKISNVQNYSNLIHNITRYTYGSNNDDILFAKFYNEQTHTYQTSYTNYDSFLAWYLKNQNPIDENPLMILDTGATEPRLLEYDDLVYSRVQKQIDLSNVFCGYYTGDSSNVIGMCLGPQDMFFSNGTDTVNASYVEDQIVSVSIVYQHGQTDAQKIIMVYINGSLTSVVRNSKGAFAIESNSIVFNSDNCDIDLYKIRVYNTSLNVNDIVMNYAADFENVDIYDQNKLAKSNDITNEYYFDYNEMLNYNIKHPNDPLMPYIIFDTTQTYPKNQQKLSYSKSVNRNVGVEFVNVPLELAYSSGELETLAKEDGLWKDGDNQAKKAEAVKTYYKHHCPSWKSIDGINMAVQGTSSEFYPRRNYKLKTKTTYDKDNDGKAEKDKKSRTHIFLNRGPFAADYEADQFGLAQNEYILSNTAYDATQTYYTDASGTTQVTFDASTPYKYNTYYIKNPAWVKLGEEKTRQDYWYMNNYTVGTTKFTMKIDFMESSGTYNMGFANLVKNGYSKHPLDDYNAAGAFEVEDPEQTNYVEATSYKAGKIYYYKNHKGNWKNTQDDELKIINNDEDIANVFADGPLVYAQAHGVKKVYGLDSSTGELNPNISPDADGYNKWYTVSFGYKAFTIPKTDDYRTSVAGFRVLAFHKKYLQDGSIYYQYIGMYNMLLDKGSDEVYGFKPDKTTGASPLQKFLKNKKISKIAECWEMENNNRTYCSFRDPDKRKDLTFKAFEMKNGEKVYKVNSVGSAPLVADSFEYRYNADGDILDYIMDPIKESNKYDSEDTQNYMTSNNVDFAFDIDDKSKNFDVRAKFLWDKYQNWEKACQWVWSTCTDYVISQGNYEIIPVKEKLWQSNTYYIFNGESYVIDNGIEYNDNINYYKKNEDNNYSIIHLTTNPEYEFNNINKNKFYIQVNKVYVSCANETEFNDSITYYTLINYSDERMAELEAEGKVDRLVQKCAETDNFDENAEYYIYDGTSINGQATTKVDITEEQFLENPTNYYIGITISNKGNTYKYDTKEYRGDKFISELSKHFDIEYLATYFVMTEVFECYDSRGKNCMMASWGPQENGGEYIWYPIFYDIDTQLGVNNTGIPSFEYNVDATEDGNYSTSDSVLWNNFYRYFKSSAIISKYKHLKGVTKGVPDAWGTLKNPPLYDVPYIEGWYTTDPDVVGQVVMRGKRPLVAYNLDEYYKYITITNGSIIETSPLYQATQDGLIGHLSSDDKGNCTVDVDGKYFYMLQGNRSLSRQQFLTNRIEYIDSWLNQGNYQRGGANRIRGRVAANNSEKTSDSWVAEQESDYWDENDNKRHLFDAEYWLTLTPTHSSYVTLGDDNEAYPSQKYDGIHPLKFEISAIKSGVLYSANYPEQLLYIYGINNMSDLGDMSKLYWQEFAIEGNAEKLTSIKFGYDGIMTENGEDIKYKNLNVNNPTFGAAKTEGSKGLPLLKYMNMCNVEINQGSPLLDLTSCEKLQNFRATGSNYSEIKFADGVALDTLYLPDSLTVLKLTEVRLLKNLITEYHTPELNTEGNLIAEPGLYLQGMFENNFTKINTLNILGSGLGYDSYKLLKKYYDIRKLQTSSESNIQMTDVQWSPYIKVNEDEEYISADRDLYFIDNGHYGLEHYSYNVDKWPIQIANGEIYKLDNSIPQTDINQITDIEMLKVFANSESALFRKDERDNVPNITGIIYVNNTCEYIKVQPGENYNNKFKYYLDNNGNTKYIYNANTWEEDINNNLYKKVTIYESEIRNDLQPKFPHLTFFFADVDQAYTARFLLMDADSGENGAYTLIGSQTIEYSENNWFNNPIDSYGDISNKKPNHDFYGWAKTNDPQAPILINLDNSINTWSSQRLDEDVHTYYFYAICTLHKWAVHFINNNEEFCTMYVEHGKTISGPEISPNKNDDPNNIEQTHELLGYNRTANATTAIDLNNFSIINDTTFYAIWGSELIDVHNDIHKEYFDIVNNDYKITLLIKGQYRSFSGLQIKLNTAVKGKLTIPSVINNQPVVCFCSSTSFDYNNIDPNLQDVTHVFFEQDENGFTNIVKIEQHTFRECNKLEYFEFAKGIYYIGNGAFSNVYNLKYSSNIEGTLSIIGSSAFSGGFKFDSDTTLLIGNIDSIESYAFIGLANTNNPTPFRLQIGTPENRISNINYLKNSNNSGQIFTQSERYTLNYSDYFPLITEVIIYPTNASLDIYQIENRKELVNQLFGKIDGEDNPYDITKITIA